MLRRRNLDDITRLSLGGFYNVDFTEDITAIYFLVLLVFSKISLALIVLPFIFTTTA